MYWLVVYYWCVDYVEYQQCDCYDDVGIDCDYFGQCWYDVCCDYDQFVIGQCLGGEGEWLDCINQFQLQVLCGCYLVVEIFVQFEYGVQGVWVVVVVVMGLGVGLGYVEWYFVELVLNWF